MTGASPGTSPPALDQRAKEAVPSRHSSKMEQSLPTQPPSPIGHEAQGQGLELQGAFPPLHKFVGTVPSQMAEIRGLADRPRAPSPSLAYVWKGRKGPAFAGVSPQLPGCPSHPLPLGREGTVGCVHSLLVTGWSPSGRWVTASWAGRAERGHKDHYEVHSPQLVKWGT